jgi:hypothetical protein
LIGISDGTGTDQFGHLPTQLSLWRARSFDPRPRFRVPAEICCYSFLFVATPHANQDDNDKSSRHESGQRKQNARNPSYHSPNPDDPTSTDRAK